LLHNKHWINLMNLGLRLFLHIMITIKAKELIGKNRQVAMKVYQWLWK
jgi:hypothetical protein